MSTIGGTTVLVTGASGNVGWGFAHAASEAGASLILPTRSADSVEALEQEWPGHRVLHADVSTAAGREALGDAIAGESGVDHVFAPIGSWWQKGPSLDQSPEELEDLLATYVTTQFGLLHLVAPWLNRAGGSYTLVSGAAGEHLLQGTGLLVVAVRAQYALSEVLRHESAQWQLRLNELRIDTRIERMARAGVVPSRVAGEEFLALLVSETRGEVLRYPGGFIVHVAGDD